jgi:hypothetical protein
MKEMNMTDNDPKTQAADQELSDTRRKLEETELLRWQLEQTLSQVRAQQRLRDTLTAAGVADMEAAILLAEQRLTQNKDAKPEQVIDQLKREKPYLFTPLVTPQAMQPTRGKKDKPGPAQQNTKPASADRKQLMQYMKTRRK